MYERLHISRGLQQRSVRDLSFRNRIAHLNERAVPQLDENLHCTIMASDESSVSLQALANFCRTQPEEAYIAKVIDVIPVGRRYKEARTSYALKLELDENIAADYAHCHEQLNIQQQDNFTPHVTLLRTIGADRSTEHDIMRNIEALSPATISLTALRTRVSAPLQSRRRTPAA